MADTAKVSTPGSIDPDVSRSWTLPSHLYFEPAILKQEVDNIFARTWQIVCRRDQVAHAGDYVTASLASEPLLVARDASGELRAFFNVCRHRAGPPAEGCGNRKVFRCGYHGWTYGLDGHLISAPEFEGVQDFRPEEFGLRPVNVAEWGAWVFVNLDAKPEPLVPSLGELPQQSARFHFGQLRFYERREYVLDCNWKTYVDNFLEGYHLPSVHPGLNKELDYGSYVTETFERHSLQYSPFRAAADDGQRRYQKGSDDDRADYYWVFPNWTLSCYPDNVSVNVILPLAPEHCVVSFEWFFDEARLATDVPAKTVRFSDEVQLEDGRICETVQRNLRSRSYQRGRFSVKQERGVHHFHRLYTEWMGINQDLGR